MVGFVHNHPDRPFVMGGMFHGQVGLGGGADNRVKSIQTKSGIKVLMNDNEKSVTVLDPSGNTYFMDGNGNISVTAPNDINFTAGANLNISVGQNMTTTVGMNQSNTIGMNRSDMITMNYSESVGALRPWVSNMPYKERAIPRQMVFIWETGKDKEEQLQARVFFNWDKTNAAFKKAGNKIDMQVKIAEDNSSIQILLNNEPLETDNIRIYQWTGNYKE